MGNNLKIVFKFIYDENIEVKFRKQPWSHRFKELSFMFQLGVNLTAQDLLRLDARIQNLNFNISEMKLSITSLYIISDAPKLFWLKTASPSQ